MEPDIWTNKAWIELSWIPKPPTISAHLSNYAEFIGDYSSDFEYKSLELEMFITWFYWHAINEYVVDIFYMLI